MEAFSLFPWAFLECLLSVVDILVSSLPLPLSSLFDSFSFSSFLLLFKTLLCMDLENIPKGNRQSKSYFKGTHNHLDV